MVPSPDARGTWQGLGSHGFTENRMVNAERDNVHQPTVLARKNGFHLTRHAKQA
jgi:hypothetical protein